MNVYIYRAALYCETCAKKIQEALLSQVWLSTVEMEDSDRFPQGPYSNGGGEADCPQHCDACRVFLDNPLTADGNAYVRDAIRAYDMDGEGNREVIETWRGAYSYLLQGNDGA